MNAGADERAKRPRCARNPYTQNRLNAAVMVFLRAFHAQNDNLPTLALLCEHFGWASINTAGRYMDLLVRAGQIEPVPGMKAYRFVRRGEPTT